MRAVIQRVSRASVVVDGEIVGTIGRGLLVFLGAGDEDTERDVDYMVDKTANLRIFPDDDDKMNLSVKDLAATETGAGVLAVSQFTLYGDARKGRRPAFIHAMEPGRANELYELYVARLSDRHVLQVETGVFRADMKVDLVNDGPVTILLDSKKNF